MTEALRVFRECTPPPLSEPFIHHLFHHGQKYKSDIPTQTLLQHQIQQNQKSQNTRYAATPVPSCSIHTTPSFQLQNDKARLVFIGRIYLSFKNGTTWDKHRRRVQWTCNGNVKWPPRDLSAYATMEETEFAPTTRLYTPRWIIERTPLIFLMVVMAQSPATSNGTIDFNDHPRPMLSPSATSSNGPPKAVHWPILFFNFSLFFFPTFQEENLSVLTLPKEPKDQDVVIQVWNWTVSPPFAPNNTPVSANQSNPSPVATVDPSPVPPSKLELYVRSWSRSKRL